MEVKRILDDDADGAAKVSTGVSGHRPPEGRWTWTVRGREVMVSTFAPLPPPPVHVDTEACRTYKAAMDDGERLQEEEAALKQAMGRAIARARTAAGYPTQAAFARAVDVRYQYMSRVEKGLENLTLQTLAKMTGVVKVPMPEFLTMVAQEMRQPTELPPARRGRPPAE